MILFLNFAPIEFMGGAEKWMYETSQFINKKERTLLISVAPEIGNLYGKIVLKRKYENRAKYLDRSNLISLSLQHFLPWTSSFKGVRKDFTEARKIYMRYEVLEMTLLIYFGGFKSIQKTISGIHSALIYQVPESFFENLHNIIYRSFLSKLFLRKSFLVHTINKREQGFLEKTFNLKNVCYVPTSIETETVKIMSRNKKKELKVLFVGEISKRKGIDILLDVIKKSPNNYLFKIAGGGPMEKDVVELCKEHSNCTYYGFLQKKELSKLYTGSDVLILPSRAEGFPLVYHEAMAHGMMIVDSPQSSIKLPNSIERTTKDLNPDSFIKQLQTCFLNRTNPKKIGEYYMTHYSKQKVQNQLLSKVFS